MGREKNRLMEYEDDAKGYSTDRKTLTDELCPKCKVGKLIYHKDETPGFKESWSSCSNDLCQHQKN